LDPDDVTLAFTFVRAFRAFRADDTEAAETSRPLNGIQDCRLP
jgi:hypothetical protein